MRKSVSKILDKINEIDDFVCNYKKMTITAEIPSTAYLNWGIHLANIGQLDVAMDKFNTAILMANQNPNAYVNLGIAFLKQQDYTEAIKNFKKATKIDKLNARAYAMWASALSEIGDMKGAVDIYKLAQKYDPRNPEIYLNWGISLAKYNNKKEAEEKFKTAVSLDPLNPTTPFLWGMLMIEQGRFEEAIKKLTHCLLFNQNTFQLYYYIAFCYSKLANYEQTITYAKKAIDEDDTKLESYMLLADAYMNTCNEDLCLETYKAAESKAVLNSQFYANWGNALQRHNHIEEAREKLYQAFSATPDNPSILFNLGANYLICGEKQEALEFFYRVIKLNPEHTQSLYNIAALSYENGEIEKALEFYKKSYDSNKKAKHVFFNIANCYYKLNDFDGAQKYYKKCIEYNPKFVHGYINYANLLLEKSNEAEALRKARTAFLLQRDSADTNFAYGIVLLKTGHHGEAYEKFINTLKINPNYSFAHVALAESAWSLGKLEEALVYLELAMDKFAQMPDFLALQEKILAEFTRSNVSQYEAQIALKYCNKFLERYNNLKVDEIRSELVQLIT